MKDIRKLTYRDFYYATLDDFYMYVVKIMKSLNYTFHRRIKDSTTRRAEVWKLFNSEDYKVLVWVEILDPSLNLTWQEAAEVLRLMNDENMTKLYLFTNGNLDEDAKDILDDESNFIYTPRNIIEKLLSLVEVGKESEEEPTFKRKRREPDRPYGHALISEYFRNKEKRKEKRYITLSELKSLVGYILVNYNNLQGYIDDIPDLDNLGKGIIDELDKRRRTFLPLLYKIIGFSVNREFNYILVALADFLKYLIYYITAIIEYESLENIENYKRELTKSLNILEKFDLAFYDYINLQIKEINKSFKNLIKYTFSLVIFIIIVILLL
ncbi:MAG: hypothetical protein SVN78_06495 [Deferribacterota bacterium]|nr:hypothetical protein [Deferribacterota bacterium]